MDIGTKLILKPEVYNIKPPTVEECYLLWEEYAMPSHIRMHSMQVAFIAQTVALALKEQEYPLCTDSIKASALLHDIAKMYCIENPAYHHNEVGALWIVEKMQNYNIAQGIYYHNYLEPETITLPYNILPVIVMYADSRVQHTSIVSIHERYDDLTIRYGTTQKKKEHIALVKEQALYMEHMLNSILGYDINTRIV